MQGSGPPRSPRRAEREHGDLWWHPQPQGECERTQPRIDIQEGRLLRACRCCIACGMSRRAERQAIQPHRKRCHETRRAPLAVPEREAYLTAMRVACKTERNAHRCGASHDTVCGGAVSPAVR